MTEPIKWKIRKMPKEVTLAVTVVETPEYKFRFWLGKCLIWLAVQVWGCSVEFKEPADYERDFDAG